MKLFSWGSNSHGQLAQGQSDDLSVPTEIVQNTCSFEDILSITGGGGHSLLVTKNGIVYSSGAIGKEESCQDDKMPNTFLKVSGLSSYKITQVTAGWDFSIALTDEGRVFTWGSNTFGQLGVTGILKSLLPFQVMFLFGVLEEEVNWDLKTLRNYQPNKRSRKN
ncbi:Hypothetical predicted protein [Octopus vulgaris]|uniref:Secretion-regulating guanine nucleotide exchange factor n=1 Tax=Octopus vulgaris TaxID=6645 RepID=A0AA36AVI4_OCTVU|nr:Hypothetical predicted protein [Octopus vulgaris]